MLHENKTSPTVAWGIPQQDLSKAQEFFPSEFFQHTWHRTCILLISACRAGARVWPTAAQGILPGHASLAWVGLDDCVDRKAPQCSIPQFPEHYGREEGRTPSCKEAGYGFIWDGFVSILGQERRFLSSSLSANSAWWLTRPASLCLPALLTISCVWQKVPVLF